MGSPQTQIALRVRSDVIARRLRESASVEVVPEEPAVEAQCFVSQRLGLKIEGESHPARLVNLPTLAETHKTFDRSTFYKCGDVSQLLIVYESEEERLKDEQRKNEGAWKMYYPDGLTPPMKEVVATRFSKARTAAKDDYTKAEVALVEQQMVDIVANQGNLPTEELLAEDIVPFEDWMIPSGDQTATIFDDSPLVAKNPWILATQSEPAPAPAPAAAKRARSPPLSAGTGRPPEEQQPPVVVAPPAAAGEPPSTANGGRPPEPTIS
ncbi:hypothetical protein CTAYLR_005609 [Chrysophaeum taylorii]|uniref:TAFII55 protein conserved region domain-containing protein n=1 Tax=Chrysophaeum taylorii TaxID=2483200 RepID=A0AAD7U821_9STRA|nr:hypothetical protein CTAYLR_005609 [Chrysophaeum taylorii]